MTEDLEQLLRRTAVEPTGGPDAGQLVARGRRRRRTRHGTAAAASLAGLLLVVGVVVGEPFAEPHPPEILERPDPDEARPDDVETIAIQDVGFELLVADATGAHRLDGDGQQQLWDTPSAVALPDRAGGVVVQDAEGGAIRRLTADGEQHPAFATPGQRPTLHAVVEHDGRPTVLFTRRAGQGDDEIETLHAYRLDDGTEEDLGVTGRLESGVDGVALVGTDLLLSRCHLECDLLRLPWGEDPASDAVNELHDRSLPLHGLDVAGEVAAYVHVPLQAPGPDEGAQPQLWLHDLGDDTHVEIPLPSPEDDHSTISVDLAADATAALVGFHLPDEGETHTLIVDELDRQPRTRWVDTTGDVRFDAPSSWQP